jgi:hypothetical protein
MTIEARSRVAVSTLVLACALSASAAWAASGRVSGQVTGPDGRPIEGVAVSAGSAAATTGPGGLYALEGVSTGRRVVVTFAKPGHATTYGVVEIPASEDTDGDGVPNDKDRCPTSDLRPTVTIDGCDTGLGNRLLRGCTAMDVFLECAERVDSCGKHGHWRKGHGKHGHGSSKPWHLLGCLAEPRFLRRVDGLTCRTLKKAISCVRSATFPLEELEDQPAPPSPEATLHRTLLPTGAARTLQAVAGGTLLSAGSGVTFFPGSIDAAGPVDAALTPLDVTSPAIGAFPGDFRAIDRSQKEVQLETSALLHVSLAQGDTPVALKSAARIELLLPPGAPYLPGARVALWLFDPSDGTWREQPNTVAIVQSSSTTPGRDAAVAFVDRPGWWNVDRPVERTCLCGRVEDARGLPVEGALVTATALDHYAVTSARSAADGAYCVEARTGSRLALRASAVVDGLRLDSAAAELTSPAAPALCEEGGCGAGPDLALPDVACIQGVALDADAEPRPGVSVVTSAGSATVTDASGRYDLPAPAEQAVTVFGQGYPPVTALTPGPGAGCAVVDLVPPAVRTTCVSGRVTNAFTNKPLAFATVEGQDALGVPYGPPVQADPQGLYSLGNLPLGTPIQVRAIGGGLLGLVPVTTGTAPGEAGSAACTPVPEIVCRPPS